jgi:hypothetical protein
MQFGRVLWPNFRRHVAILPQSATLGWGYLGPAASTPPWRTRGSTAWLCKLPPEAFVGGKVSKCWGRRQAGDGNPGLHTIGNVIRVVFVKTGIGKSLTGCWCCCCCRSDRLYDKVTGLLRPNNFTDLGEALINQGLPAALALVRDSQTG